MAYSWIYLIKVLHKNKRKKKQKIEVITKITEKYINTILNETNMLLVVGSQVTRIVMDYCLNQTLNIIFSNQ